ncbi:MAG: transketolase C-terminal domain-containing protein, partial [Patescibacteria group bacterium]
MAAVGKIPFISSYAMFSPGRNWEQIRTTICYNNQNVKIAGAHSGVSVGPDGATHQAIEDIAITRVIPNMVVIAPCDAIEAKKATIASARHKGPVYVRFTREKTPVMTTEETPFEIGKAEIFREGKDVTLIGCGPLVYEALKAAEELAKEGIEAEVINNHTVKPMDKETILKSVKKTGCVVTIEEHQAAGGMGSAISELLSKNLPTPMEIIGIQDRFGESGEPSELLEKFGLTAKNIVEAAKMVIKRK